MVIVICNRNVWCWGTSGIDSKIVKELAIVGMFVEVKVLWLWESGLWYFVVFSFLFYPIY